MFTLTRRNIDKKSSFLREAVRGQILCLWDPVRATWGSSAERCSSYTFHHPDGIPRIVPVATQLPAVRHQGHRGRAACCALPACRPGCRWSGINLLGPHILVTRRRRTRTANRTRSQRCRYSISLLISDFLVGLIRSLFSWMPCCI
jgi:hypothetical protein